MGTQNYIFQKLILKVKEMVALQAPLSMEVSRQEYYSGLPFPSPGDLPNPGIEPGSSVLQADSLQYEPPGKPGDTFQKLILPYINFKKEKEKNT